MFSPSLSVWDDSFLVYSLQPVALQGLHRVPWMCMSVLLNWNSFDSFKHIGKSSHFGMKMYIFCIKSWLCFCVSVCFFSKPSVYNSGHLFLLWRYGFYERLRMLQKTFDSNFAGSTYHSYILIVWERLRKKLHHILFVWHFQTLMLLIGCFGLFYFALFKLAKAVLAPQKQNKIHKIRFSLKEKKSFCVFFLSFFFSSIIDFSEERDLEYRCVYVIIIVLVQCCILAEIQYQ